MKIWIDFINTPQVSFFSLLVKSLEERGHKILFTCRDSGNTVSLIKQYGWDVVVIGDKVQKGTLNKMIAFPSRIIKLMKFVKTFGPEIAVCQSSFYLPLTAYLLRIPAIYTNDNEHALGNIPSFLFAKRIFISEHVPLEKILKQGARRHKIIKYPGVKEGIYLWEDGIRINKLRLNKSFNKIYIRPEPSTAQYYKGNNNFLDEIIEFLQNKYEVAILPRDNDQVQYYKSKNYSNVFISEGALKFEEIALDCKLFIGAGGSMTREMAIIGIPSVSVYQDELLGVDRFLVSAGLLIHEPNLQLNRLMYILNEIKCPSDFDFTLIEHGKRAFEMFENEILSLK